MKSYKNTIGFVLLVALVFGANLWCGFVLKYQSEGLTKFLLVVFSDAFIFFSGRYILLKFCKP